MNNQALNISGHHFSYFKYYNYITFNQSNNQSNTKSIDTTTYIPDKNIPIIPPFKNTLPLISIKDKLIKSKKFKKKLVRSATSFARYKIKFRNKNVLVFFQIFKI